MNDAYKNLIEQYLYMQFPTATVSKEVRFEAISKAILGTKQRRHGPLPSPEMQVRIREVVRYAIEHNEIQFFLPWGASKHTPDTNMDILELTALKQLRCLSEELSSYGLPSKFIFRLEDLGDEALFGRGHRRERQIKEYIEAFQTVTQFALPNSEIRLESDCTTSDQWHEMILELFHVFYQYLLNPSEVYLQELEKVGWKGGVPEEQRQFYRDAFIAMGVPSGSINNQIAQYFATVLTRVKQGAHRTPTTPYIAIAFSHPVPGDPSKAARVHYRTIPERYTHQHKSPWNAKGYLRIEEDERITPRFFTEEDKYLRIIPNTKNINGAIVDCDYFLA